MKSKQKNTFKLRGALIASIILCFVFFTVVFTYQYKQYKQVEDRLNTAYSNTYSQSSSIYKLFSTFSEADNLFRLYTIDFNPESYNSYRLKLDSIKLFVDSIASLPIEDNPMKLGSTDLKLSNSFATEFASLKKNIDHLILFASDSLQILHTKNNLLNNRRQSFIGTDSIINKIMQDSIKEDVVQDTLVKRKKSLFNRIFNSTNDTLVSQNTKEVLSSKQLDIVQRNIEHFITTNEKIYSKGLYNLQVAFQKLQAKERQLLLTNYNLLANLKHGLDHLRELELEKIRETESKDFTAYRENFQNFRNQIIATLTIMLLMIIFIIYYHYKVASFEKKLFLEKEYASHIAEEKTSVLANISHEIRTPLNSLKGIVDILKSNDKNTIDKEIIQTVDNDISVINTTINDILNLSKLEAGSLEIKNAYFAPYQLIEEVIALHTYQAKIKGLTLKIENNLDPKLNIYSNAFRIKQVISNLISNAIKYTKQGSIHVHASIKSINQQKQLIVDVVDTGIGIPADKKDQVFRKYYVVDSKSKAGSFGLGLYISQILSEQIKGSISFISTAGKGSTFTFTLPIDHRSFQFGTDRTYTISDLGDSIDLVIIDDSRINLFFIQQLFAGKKEVALFNNSAQAWQHIQSHKVDVVITDLIMPEMDGWEILNQIKSDQTLSHIKVLACTAEAMLLEDKAHKEYLFDGIIAKPVQENDMVLAILKTRTNQ